jgi:hypothetical protein
MEDAQVSGRGFLGLSQNGISAHEIIGAQCRFIRKACGVAGKGRESKLTDGRQTPRRVDGGKKNWLLNLGRRSALELQACIADMVEGWDIQKQPFMSSVLNQSVIPTCLKQIESSFSRGVERGQGNKPFCRHDHRRGMAGLTSSLIISCIEPTSRRKVRRCRSSRETWSSRALASSSNPMMRSR